MPFRSNCGSGRDLARKELGPRQPLRLICPPEWAYVECEGVCSSGFKRLPVGQTADSGGWNREPSVDGHCGANAWLPGTFDQAIKRRTNLQKAARQYRPW